MKKVVFFIFIITVITVNSNAQVGVNTETPQHPLHIKGGAGSGDDVVVTNDGRVGIGTASPDAALKLDVRGNMSVSGNVEVGGNSTTGGNLSTPKIGLGTKSPETHVHIVPGSIPPLRLKDGSEMPDYLLTADNNGNAFWGALRPMSSRITAAIDSIPQLSQDEFRIITNTDSLLLAPGKWLIFAQVVTTDVAGGTGFYTYLHLYRGNVGVNRVGAYSEATPPYKAVNQLMYLAEVPYSAPNGHKFTLGLSSSRATQIAPRFGNYFYAVRIDR